jgi:hypothetical protein
MVFNGRADLQTFGLRTVALRVGSLSSRERTARLVQIQSPTDVFGAASPSSKARAAFAINITDPHEIRDFSAREPGLPFAPSYRAEKEVEIGDIPVKTIDVFTR